MDRRVLRRKVISSAMQGWWVPRGAIKLLGETSLSVLFGDQFQHGCEVGLRIGVTVENLLLAHPAHRLDEGGDQARSVLARRAVEEYWMVLGIAAQHQHLHARIEAATRRRYSEPYEPCGMVHSCRKESWNNLL
jgi:hypothetical protein